MHEINKFKTGATAGISMKQVSFGEDSMESKCYGVGSDLGER
jgi:hypothetical protein